MYAIRLIRSIFAFLKNCCLLALSMKRIIGKITVLFAVLFGLALAPFNGTVAQITCNISIDPPRPVYTGIYFELSVLEEPNLIFDWEEKPPGGSYVSVGNEAVYGTTITDSTIYKVTVIDTLAHDTCRSEPFGVGVKAQLTCGIELVGSSMPVCPDIYFELQLEISMEPHLIFDWQKKEGTNYVSVGNEPIYGTGIVDSTVYIVTVIDTLNYDTCESEPFGVGVYPQIDIEFDQLQLTCTNGDNDNGKTAQVRAIATGELQADEYHYFWDLPDYAAIDPGDSSLAIGMKAHQYYAITVRDNHGCPKKDTVWTEAYYNPEVEIFSDPDTTAYLQNPFVTYSYENLSIDSLSISNRFWWFQDSVPDPDYTNTSDALSPIYEYTQVGQWDVVLTVYNEQGCDTTFVSTIEVKPIELYIPNVFTPDLDGNNDTFIITDDPEKKVRENALSKFYVSSHLIVFNRMGRTVFEAENYNGMWDGDNLPEGVYYYVLECHGVKSSDVFKGSVTIIRPN